MIKNLSRVFSRRRVNDCNFMAEEGIKWQTNAEAGITRNGICGVRYLKNKPISIAAAHSVAGNDPRCIICACRMFIA